jgi:hypothetical protein
MENGKVGGQRHHWREASLALTSSKDWQYPFISAIKPYTITSSGKRCSNTAIA